jgi:hypothetical protein
LLIPIPELIRFRTQILKKPTEQPDIVMVTASGWIDIKHPAWNTKRRKMIATSQNGLSKLTLSLQKQISSDSNSSINAVDEWLLNNQMTIRSFDDTNPDDVNLMALAEFLKSEWKVEYLDVSAGPTLISLMVKAYGCFWFYFRLLLKSILFTSNECVIDQKPIIVVRCWMNADIRRVVWLLEDVQMEEMALNCPTKDPKPFPLQSMVRVLNGTYQVVSSSLSILF